MGPDIEQIKTIEEFDGLEDFDKYINSNIQDKGWTLLDVCHEPDEQFRRVTLGHTDKNAEIIPYPPDVDRKEQNKQLQKLKKAMDKAGSSDDLEKSDS